MRLLNVPMRLLLRLPLRTPLSERLMLVFLVGRRSGKIYRQPVSYVTDAGTLLTPAGGRWRLNLVAGNAVRLRLCGENRLAYPELISEPGEVERLLLLIFAANPRAASFVGIPRGPGGGLDRARLEQALAYGFRVVRWHLDEHGQRARGLPGDPGTVAAAGLPPRPGGERAL
jgi:hypothetical protein